MIKVGNSNRKLALKCIGFFGIICIVCYPIIIAPKINPTPYKEIQKISRKGIDREKIQPGNMKIWSDPFDRKK